MKKSLLLLCLALFLRLLVAVVSPGTGDVTNFVKTARLAQGGQIIYKFQEFYPYPPTYAWVLDGLISLSDALPLSPRLAVRLPSIVADSLIAVLLYFTAYRLRRRARFGVALLYVVNPITILIASHHGQFDSLAYLPAVGAMLVHLWNPNSLAVIAFLLGMGGALKIIPLFLLPSWWPDLGKRRTVWFTLLAVTPLLIVTFVGWAMAPQEFVQNVLGYRTVAEGGWGYNFVTLILIRIFRQMRFREGLYLLEGLRSLHQYVLVGGLLAVTWLTWNRTWFERIVLLQLAIPLLAGRWGHEYNAWIVPVAILANQKGVLPWGGLTVIWMIIAYIGFVTSPSSLQDNLFRAATVIGFGSWLSLLAWFLANLLQDQPEWGRFLGWFKSALFAE